MWHLPQDIDFLKSSPEDMFIDFREIGGERERETSVWKRNINRLPLKRALSRYMPWPGIEPSTFDVQNDAPTNLATQPRLDFFFHIQIRQYFTRQSTVKTVNIYYWISQFALLFIVVVCLFCRWFISVVTRNLWLQGLIISLRTPENSFWH